MKTQICLKRISFYILSFTFFILFGESCNSQNSTQKTSSKSFVATFHKEITSQILLLGYLVYEKHAKEELRFDQQENFINLAATFKNDLTNFSNIDSLIDSSVKRNSIDFFARKAIIEINQYILCYRIVSDLIFVDVESDDNVQVMNQVETKILRVPEMALIYRSYIPKGQNMSSLSSNEGVALYIQLAYYLYLQKADKKNNIIKALL